MSVGLHQVTKRFGDVVAVDRIDLEIADGEFFSLLGPSGCGKTTTLRMIAGLEFPTEGSITIFGEEVALVPPNHRPVNTVFQSYALFPHMTVAENVAFGLEMRKVPREEVRRRVADAIDLVRLTGMADRKPDQLSGGQQQRVALARALVNRPKVLLLDEPLGALDLKLRQAMQIELKDIQREVGITFVYVTHDQEEALTMSDRICVMNEGRVLQVGTPEEIYERPTSRFVADFIGETNFLDAVVTGPGRVRIGDTEVRVATDAAAGTRLTVMLRPEKLQIHAPDEPVAEERNRLEGRIRHRLYYGDALEYEVELPSGEVLDVRMENVPSHRRWGPGEEVAVSFRHDAADALTE